MTNGLLNTIFVEPWPFWVGGILIGLLVPLLYYFYNTALGVSTGYGNLVKIVIPPSRSIKWIKESFAETVSWRVFFIAGIVIGAFISSLLSGQAGFTMAMGVFTSATGWPFLLNALYFFFGGLLLGFGARVARGCTSGHSIHGIANLHISSIIATILFLIGGIAAANLIRLVFIGGAF